MILHRLSVSLLLLCIAAGAQAASVSLTANPGSPAPGDAVLVEILAANDTGSTATGLSVELTFPGDLAIMNESVVSGDFDAASSCDDTGTFATQCSPGDLLVWNLGDLAAGEVRRMTFVANVDGAAADDATIGFTANLIQSISTIAGEPFATIAS